MVLRFLIGIFASVLSIAPAKAQSDGKTSRASIERFSGSWSGSGRFTYNGDSKACQELKVNIETHERSIVFGGGHAECDGVSVNWKAYTLTVSDGQLYTSSGERIGTIGEHVLQTEIKNSETGSISKREFILDGAGLLLRDSITDVRGDVFFTLEGPLSR